MEATCDVCFHHCKLKNGARGLCRARKNENGKIICENYGRITSMALDPIEKKPLKMFCRGSKILSVGSYGCNLRCPFCQNHEISMAGQEDIGTRYISPKELVNEALYYEKIGNIGIAFTYNEPLISWEYVLDTSRLLHEQNMKSVLVTNGTVSLPVMETLLPYIDAMNIDLKGFRDEYYGKLGGSLDAVKDVIQCAAAACHVELTTLIVSNENDALGEMEEEAKWIASVSDSIPLHVTRFFPNYHMQDRGATDVKRVYELKAVAERYLKNVFVGNC
ncbi:MAG: AmmeMemoRadiSam system radical SAM enzyme [Clostridium sp.]|nr:AmmeMemoRadiSam system radical SAM enzyme [Clostridium sp.]MCM1208257.1 AmmeMemoRadiSam system radical SAM enzyme [Ruminococcus sp.]